MDRNGFSLDIMDKGLIDGKTWAGINDLISRITVGLLTETDRRFCTGKDNNSIRRCFKSTGFTKVLRNRFPERKGSLRITLMCIVQIKLPLHFFLNKFWNRKVRFSQITFDHFLPLFFDGPDLRPDLKGILRIDKSSPL